MAEKKTNHLQSKFYSFALQYSCKNLYVHRLNYRSKKILINFFMRIKKT